MDEGKGTEETIVGLGAFNIIDLQELDQRRIKKFVQRTQEITKSTCTPKWYEAEKTENKLKVLQAYQMAIITEDNLERDSDEYYHGIFSALKIQKQIIEDKKNYN